MDIFRRYELVIKIINSTVFNKLNSYSRISAIGPEGHCKSRFRRAMCISCRPHVDVHKGCLAHVDRGKGVKIPIFLRHKWMAPNCFEQSFFVRAKRNIFSLNWRHSRFCYLYYRLFVKSFFV